MIWQILGRISEVVMLATGTAVTHVALDLRFSTASAFIAMFRQAFGETPAAYQRRL